MRRSSNLGVLGHAVSDTPEPSTEIESRQRLTRKLAKSGSEVLSGQILSRLRCMGHDNEVELFYAFEDLIFLRRRSMLLVDRY